MQVLIADDDPVYRSLLAELLTQWEYDVVVACDGLEAWNLFQADPPPKLVLLDWMMPGLDGFDLCSKIRNESSAPNDTYIILLTGSRRKSEIITALVAGADDYLIKPFEPLDLKIRLRAAKRILDLCAEVAELRQPVGTNH